MQELGVRKQDSRSAQVVPLAHLQHNVLPAHVRTLQNTPRVKPAAACTEIVFPKPPCAPSEPIQKLLKALDLLQYSAVFAKEEIDQEALQCLSAQDLQAIGVRDPSHRRKLLSAALQLQSACTTHIASHTLEKPTDPTASQHTKQTTSAQTAAPLLKKEYGTAAQRTQHACADWQPRTTSLSGCSSAVRLDKQAVLRLQQQDKAKMQVVASMAVNGDSSISNNNATKLNAPRNIAPGQSASAAAEPATSLANKSHKVKYSQTAGRSATASSTAGASIASISQAHGQLHPSSSSLLSCPCVAPVAGKITQNSKRAQRPTSTESAAAATVQAHQSSKNGLSVASAATAAGMVNSTGPNSKHAHMRKLSAAAAKGGVVEPKSKADEEHQLALALSASMGEPLAGDPVLLMKTKSAKSAAAEGVFSTMMTASRQSSRQQSASQPQASTAASSDTHQTFSRHSEQMLLDRVFSDVLDTSASAPAQLQSFGFGAASRCCSEATAVEGEASLWKQASQDEPPHCTLEDRVQKRKAAQHIAQEQARKEAIAQQCIAAEAMLKSCETAEPSGSVNKAVDKQLCSLRNCPESGGQSMCIDLVSSPGEKSQEGATCSQQLPAAACAAVLSKLQDVNDPMKRIRLLALQQELKAAKQTVSDLERMILEVNSST